MTRVTSFRIDERTAEILHILNVPFTKVVYRGLASLCIDRKITNPRVIQLIQRAYQEHLEDMDHEKQFMEAILRSIEEGKTEDTSPKVEEIVKRADHISRSTTEWLQDKDNTYAIQVLRNIIISNLEGNINRYDGNTSELITDLTLLKDSAGTEPIESEALDLIFKRSDLKEVMEKGLIAARKMLADDARMASAR